MPYQRRIKGTLYFYYSRFEERADCGEEDGEVNKVYDFGSETKGGRRLECPWIH